MTEVLTAGDGAALAAVEEALDGGALVVFPTDTVYGVAARPEPRGATARIFEAKRRPRGLTLPVLAATAEDAGTVAVLDDRARVLAPRFWPGALTLVLPRAPRSRGWDLGDERDTVGVRVPDHHVAMGLLRRTGPLAVTSANVSGEPTAADCEGVRAALGDAVAVYLCAGPPPAGRASTVVDLSAAEPRIVRAGAVPPDLVLAALR